MLHWLTMWHCVWTRPGMMLWCGGLLCIKNYLLPSDNEEYYTTAPKCETLRSRMSCWFAYFVASHVHQRSIFLPSIEYRINVEVECCHSYNNWSLLSPFRCTHYLPYHILLAVSALEGSHDWLLEYSNCCLPNKVNNASTLVVSVFILLQWLKRPSGTFYSRFPTSSPWRAVLGAFTHQDWLDLQDSPFSWRNMHTHFFRFLQPISGFGLYFKNENQPSGTFRLGIPYILDFSSSDWTQNNH